MKRKISLFFLSILSVASFSQSFGWLSDGYTNGSGGGVYHNVDGSGIDLQITGLYNDETKGESHAVTGINNHNEDAMVHEYRFIFSEKVDVTFSIFDINQDTKTRCFVDQLVFSGNPVFSEVWGLIVIGDSLVKPNNAGNLTVEYYDVDTIIIRHGEGIACNPGYIVFSPIDFVKSAGPRDLYKEEITFEDIHFSNGKSDLRKSELKTLDSLFQFMITNPNAKIELRGYTDNVGNEQENYNLSVDRVAEVLDYFLNHGLERNRIRVMSYGESLPVDTNSTEEGRQKNRRVEIKIILPSH